jgi:phage FluMu protein Com
MRQTIDNYPDPRTCSECGEVLNQVGYDTNFEGAELIELECPKCGRLSTVEGKKRWTAGRI